MHCSCAFIPPQIFKHILAAGTPRQRQIALLNLTAASELRGERKALSNLSSLFAVAPGVKKRTIYDAGHGMVLPGRIVRSEGEERIKDISANEAYDGTGHVYDFFLKAYGRNSIDGQGMRLDSTVHYRRQFSNAFWNGQQMVFGDGDGEIFGRFTRSLDIVAHEMTHGITQFESGLRYIDQAGALNESISDVFGALAKQYLKKQTAEKADWLIGADLFTENINGVAIRSMKAPGSAYDDPLIGKDEQPAHMEDYVDTTEDNGGVHINSGIPNKAFYNLAISLGGNAWTIAGQIWYVALLEKVKAATDFSEFASMTFEVAGTLYGKRSKEQQAVKRAWADVGVELE
jgi:Zn-dependent metalloprotease